MIVFAIFAETTTPTFVLRRSRRHVNCSFSPTAAGTGATRLRATVRLPTGRAATAALAGALAGAFAGAAARVAAAFAGAFARVAAFAVVFFSVFSAIRLTLNRSLAHHREQAGDLSACVRHRAEGLELPPGELELPIAELFPRAAPLVRDLFIRQPPHVLHPPLPPLSR